MIPRVTVLETLGSLQPDDEVISLYRQVVKDVWRQKHEAREVLLQHDRKRIADLGDRRATSDGRDLIQQNCAERLRRADAEGGVGTLSLDLWRQIRSK